MHKIDTPGADAASEFTSGNPFAAIPATVVGHEWLNSIQRELVKVVEDEGLSLDKNDDTQLSQALTLLWLSRLNAEVGRTLTFGSAPYSGNAGDGVLVGDTFGIASANFTIGNPVVLVFWAKNVQLPKDTPLTITQGDALFWDDAAREVNLTPGGNHHIGLAAQDAGSPISNVQVQLYPPGRPAD